MNEAKELLKKSIDQEKWYQSKIKELEEKLERANSGN